MRLISDIVSNILKNCPHWLLLAVVEILEIKNRCIRNKARRLAQIPPLNQLDLSTTKNSDTVFLLGSGSSICEIGEHRWTQMGQCDSFGFNFMVNHPFVPTHYFFEPSSRECFDIKLSLFAQRGEKYRNVIKILTPAFPTKAQEEMQFQMIPDIWKENLYEGGVYRTITRNQSELTSEIERLKRKGVFEPGRNHIYRLFKHMGTIHSLITVAVAMSYKNIVLCGIDIGNKGYFYDDVEIYPKLVEYTNNYRLKHYADLDNCSLTQTPTKLVMLELFRQVIKPAGINLYVENSSSGLFPDLAVAPASIYEQIDGH